MAKSSDIISIAVGETWRHAGMVAKASGSAITAGTVNYYLKAKSGANVGKWWNNGDQTWAASETANAMSHDADGNWTIELAASPFTDGVLYLEYAKESGDLHVAGEGKLLRGQANPFNGITSLADWLGALAGKTADTATRAEINATTAGAGYNETTDSAEAIRDRGDAAWSPGSAGTGTRAVAFMVTTGGVPLQGASVRLYRTGSTDRIGTTNASGQVTLYCDVDATWSYAVTHALYESGSGTVVVDGNEAVPVSLTALSWPDSTEPNTVTVRWKVKLGVGRVTATTGEATVYVRMKAGAGTAGFAYGTRQDSDATDASGYVYFANVPVGGRISAKLGSSGAEKVYEIAADATTPYDMGELIGDA